VAARASVRHRRRKPRPNPIDEIMDRLGEWGLRLLLATLMVSPLAVTLRKRG